MGNRGTRSKGQYPSGYKSRSRRGKTRVTKLGRHDQEARKQQRRLERSVRALERKLKTEVAMVSFYLAPKLSAGRVVVRLPEIGMEGEILNKDKPFIGLTVDLHAPYDRIERMPARVLLIRTRRNLEVILNRFPKPQTG
jgi:hypothetical protein